ncbi:hypothetical protein [Maribellus mangrovi]|uniref:hypothetical protein n=1 Tax=Maribellus mangrovi TaxID=3133146 RepID=UPI0030ECC338
MNEMKIRANDVYSVDEPRYPRLALRLLDINSDLLTDDEVDEILEERFEEYNEKAVELLPDEVILTFEEGSEMYVNYVECNEELDYVDYFEKLEDTISKMYYGLDIRYRDYERIE